MVQTAPLILRRTLLAGMAAAPVAAALTDRAGAADPNPLEEALAASGAPALAAGVFDASGTLFLDAAGLRQARGSAAATPADLWHIGSNTKAMTALLYARLVEQGRIAANAPLKTLLPDIPIDPAFAERTAEDLMAHAAGLGDEALGPDWLIAAHADTRPLPEQRLALAAAALGVPARFPEGGFHYANINFVIAGVLIERATGAPWEQVIRAELFEPLGMASAGFGAPQGDQPWGHRLGVAIDPKMLGADNPPALGPAGTVHVTLEDHAKFLRLFLGDGGGFVSAAAIERIVSVPVDGDQSYRMGWMAFGHRGWAKGPALAHEGSNTMWHQIALVAPRRNLVIVAASNDGDKGAQATQAAASALIKRFAPA